MPATDKKVKVAIATLAKGTEVEVPGLGVFLNGSTATVDADRIAQYETSTGEKFKGSELEISTEQAPAGPTKPSPDYVQLETGIESSAEVLEDLAERQKERDEDPKATANIGLTSKENK